MRICSPQLGLSPRSILGGEIYDRELLLRFAEVGVEVEVLLPLGKPHPKHKRLHVTRVPVPFVVPPHLYNLLILPQLFWLYRRRPFEILRIHSPTFVGLAGVIFKLFHPEVKLVGNYHWLGEGGWMEKLLDPLLMRYFDLVICDSLRTAKQLAEQYPKALGKIVTIHNGTDHILLPGPKNKRLMAEYGIDNKTVVTLFMGLFIERKNPLFLLPIIKQLQEKRIQVRLLLCGQGPLAHVIQRRISELGIGELVRVVPPVHGQTKVELMRLSDIYVHPATNEGFPLSLIEAMAVGLPLVVTDGFSAREAVSPGENGFLCDSLDSWLSALMRLCQSSQLRKRLGKASFVKARKEFTWEKSARLHLKYFKKIVGENKIKRQTI